MTDVPVKNVGNRLTDTSTLISGGGATVALACAVYTQKKINEVDAKIKTQNQILAANTLEINKIRGVESRINSLAKPLEQIRAVLDSNRKELGKHKRKLGSLSDDTSKLDSNLSSIIDENDEIKQILGENDRFLEEVVNSVNVVATALNDIIIYLASKDKDFKIEKVDMDILEDEDFIESRNQIDSNESKKRDRKSKKNKKSKNKKSKNKKSKNKQKSRETNKETNGTKNKRLGKRKVTFNEDNDSSESGDDDYYSQNKANASNSGSDESSDDEDMRKALNN